VQQFAVYNFKLESHKLLHSVTPSLELLIEPFNYMKPSTKQMRDANADLASIA